MFRVCWSVSANMINLPNAYPGGGEVLFYKEISLSISILLFFEWLADRLTGK